MNKKDALEVTVPFETIMRIKHISENVMFPKTTWEDEELKMAKSCIRDMRSSAALIHSIIEELIHQPQLGGK